MGEDLKKRKTADSLSQTKALMGALVRMKPKPHEDLKVGKKKPDGQKAKKTKR